MVPLQRRLALAPTRPWPARPVPIALVITELDVGGAEKALVQLATRLDRRRWSPEVLALGPEGALAQALRAAEVPVHCLEGRRGRPVELFARLVKELRRQRPWLVQSFLFHANILTRLAAPLAGAPWTVGGLRVAERRNNRHLRIDRLTIGLCAGEVCVSEGVRRFAIETGGLPPERLAVVPNGIDLEEFDRRAGPVAARAPGPTRFLFVGRIEPQKGWRDLVAAFGRLPEGKAELTIVGDGPERQALLDESGGRVSFLGRRDDVPRLLVAHDALVLPSLWEGMPNVVLEAMAARRAVIASDVEGTNELVVPGQTGLLVPPGDRETLAKALSWAAESPGAMGAMGQTGRARAELRHGAVATVRAYETIWAGLLGLPRALVEGVPPLG